MTKLAELQILEMLGDGIDPRTGAFLNTPRNVELDTCRLRYLRLLRTLDRQLALNQSADAGAEIAAGKNKFGARWAPEEDKIVRDRWADPAGPSARIIGTELGRTEGAILARLVTLQLVPDRDQARAENERRIRANGADRGLPGHDGRPATGRG